MASPLTPKQAARGKRTTARDESLNSNAPTLLPTAANPIAVVQRMKANPHGLHSNDILYLQRTIGNRAVAQMLQNARPSLPIQPKLKVGAANDRYEQEADRVAQQVIAPQGSQAPLQRATPKPQIQRWPFKKKAKRSFDNPKHYNDPAILKSDRKPELLVKAGAAIYSYDPGTDTIGAFIQDSDTEQTDSNFRPKERTKPGGRKEPGFVASDSLWVSAMGDMAEVVTAQHTKSTRELFPKTGKFLLTNVTEEGDSEGVDERRMPEVGDIRQGAIADCWLEAALIAIVASDPQHIMDMMKDHGDTVTVRLYEVSRANPAKPTFTPRYINVNKSVVKKGHETLYQSDGGVLWVSMVQKAYAAGGFSGTTGARSSTTTKKPGGYSNLESGLGQHAFEVILGRPSLRGKGVLGGFGEWINSGKAQNSPNMSKLPWSTGEVAKYDLMARPTRNYSGLVSFQIFQNKGKVDQWIRWVRKPKNKYAINSIFMKRRNLGLIGLPKGLKLGNLKMPYQRDVRLEHLEAIFAAKGLDNSLIPPLTTYLGKFFPGKRGTGKYTDKQLDVYGRIQEAIDNSKAVSAGVPHVAGRTAAAGVGHSGGESKYKGLVGGHAYAVLGVHDDGNVRYVIVRNPWGTYGRDYDKTDDGRMKPKVNEDEGTSNIELSDFTKRFSLLWIA